MPITINTQESLLITNALDVLLAIVTDDPDLDSSVIHEFKDAFSSSEIKELHDRIWSSFANSSLS